MAESLQFFIIPLVLGLSGAWIMANFGYKIGLLDLPKDRSSHSLPTPKGGGIGILISFVIFACLNDYSWLFWLPALFISLVSFQGDRFDIPPKIRLFLQLGAAIIALNSTPFTDLSLIESSLLIGIMSIFIAGTANFYNFMDGINGIASITGIVSFGLLAYWGITVTPEAKNYILPAVMACSCLGFLPLNLASKVFMGDVGSILLGFLFATLVVFMSQSITDFICLSSFLFTFYADELTTMAERIKNKESLTQAHRKHLYQILANELGIAHWKISFSYGIIQLILGIAVINLKSFGLLPVLSFLIFSFIIFGIQSAKIKAKARLKA